MGRAIGRSKITVTLTDANTAYRISNVTILTTDFEIYVPAGNTGASIYVGNNAVNTSWIPRPKGGYLNYVSGSGTMAGRDAALGFDLSQIYVYGTSAGDTVIVEYADFISI